MGEPRAMAGAFAAAAACAGVSVVAVGVVVVCADAVGTVVPAECGRGSLSRCATVDDDTCREARQRGSDVGDLGQWAVVGRAMATQVLTSHS